MIGGKRREIGLGGFPSVTLARAREKRDAIEEGVDPVAERRAAQSALRAANSLSTGLVKCVLNPASNAVESIP